MSPLPLSPFKAEHLELHLRKLKSWVMQPHCMGFFLYIPWITIKRLYSKNQCMREKILTRKGGC